MLTQVSYHENLDGHGKFGPRQTIYPHGESFHDKRRLWTATVADVDNDTFDDVVLAFHGDDDDASSLPEILVLRNRTFRPYPVPDFRTLVVLQAKVFHNAHGCRNILKL